MFVNFLNNLPDLTDAELYLYLLMIRKYLIQLQHNENGIEALQSDLRDCAMVIYYKGMGVGNGWTGLEKTRRL